jgi:hypothetical protein
VTPMSQAKREQRRGPALHPRGGGDGGRSMWAQEGRWGSGAGKGTDATAGRKRNRGGGWHAWAAC